MALNCHRLVKFVGTSLLTLLCTSFLTGCGGSDTNSGSALNSCTLEGTVIFWQGNFMPGVAGSPSPTSGTKTPVAREVFIFEPTAINEVTQLQGAFYSDIQTKLITTTMSDDNGHFSVNLPAGQYSLFVKENDLYYSNLVDKYFTINPVNIISGATTTVEFDIIYQAYF